ncbi:MAG: Ig-like domain-containing protein [Verrucomicrobia subdivision 3 bacterium]|nr:Ig-like domain-containing protein [Limisphaerales bacterium]
MNTNRNYSAGLVGLVIALFGFVAQNGHAFSVITTVVETGGDNETNAMGIPTDTVTAKWTGITFVNNVANEPIPGTAATAPFTVGVFGNGAPSYVDRNHRYTNAVPAGLPAYLIGQDYIMSGNDNRDNTNYVLDVTVRVPVNAYLLVDNRLGDPNSSNADPPSFGPTKMQWVLDQGWAAVMTGANRSNNVSVPDEVGIDEGADGTINQWFSVYTKSFPAGTFQLRQADNAGQNMYGVVIAAVPDYANNFNSDPSASLTIRTSATWVATGSYDGSGYISITDNVNSQQGTIVLPDFDSGATVAGFILRAKVRIGGGTADPADGMSISFCEAGDPVVASGTVGEEGTSTGLSVNIDTWDNGAGESRGIQIKNGGAVIASQRFAGRRDGDEQTGYFCQTVLRDSAGNPVALATDPSGTADPGTFVDLEIRLCSWGTLSVTYKGLEIFKDVVTGYVPRPGRFVFGARTGGANDNHWIDDLTIVTDTSPQPPRVASALPAPNPALDVSETSTIQFVINYSGSTFTPNLASIRLTIDGVDVTPTVADDAMAKTTTVTHVPTTAYSLAARHEAVLTYNDSETPALTATARKVFHVTPVPVGTVAGTTLFIEAEDFNYFNTNDMTAGHFFDFGAPAGSYTNLAAKHDIDYHLAASNPDSPLYRVLMPPNGISVPGGAGDNLRAGVPINPDYKVGWNDAGDWYNFTRTFPNTTYKIYGRFASGGTDSHFDLSRVTSDSTVSNQTTVSLGTFDAEPTGGWDTFCFIPLRNASGQDVIVRLNGLTTLRLTTLPGNGDVNYIAFVPTVGPTLRPTLVSASPANGSTNNVRDPLIKVVIADADTQVVPGSIRLFLDGTELLPLVVTDTAGGAEAEFQITAPLPENSSHTARVIFADNDATPVSQTNTWTFAVGVFKSGTGTLFIEAEDFNYSDDGTNGGLHANFGDPDCSLLNKTGVREVDYFQTSGNDPGAVPAYRPATDVEIAKPGTDGFIRGDHTITCSYIVGWNDPNEWYNYTRDFGASARYNVYARLSSGGANENAELARITSDPTATGQTKEVIGTFNSPPTGNWDVFHTVPLRDGAGNLVSVRLGGVTTLRFTVLPGNLDYNYLAFVKADVQVVTPTVASVEPRPDSDYARVPKVIAVIRDQDSAVVASSLKLTFDGTDVTSSSTITDTATGAMIMFQAPGGSAVGTAHTVKVEWQDDQTTPAAGSFTWTYREGIYSAEANLFVEVEDFNTASGTFIPSSPGHPFNEKGQYLGLDGVRGVDYNDFTGDSHQYRSTNVMVGMVNLDDSYRTGAGPRPGFEVVSDYKIGWTDANPANPDWYNYTRDFGGGNDFQIFLRASHGDAAATIGGRLDLVEGATGTNQTATALGNFRAPATGNWDGFTFIPLKDTNGSVVTVSLVGVKTLRYTVEANGGDINYLMLCPLLPANDCPVANPLAVSVKPGSSVNFQLPATDANGDALQYAVTQPPAHGVVVVQAQTGAATYTPNPGYSGPDSFSFTARDGRCESQPAVVSITVANECPVANSQTISVNQDSSVNFQLSATDADGDPLQYSVSSPPAHGVVVANAQTGAATYTPAPGYCGPDSFKFTASDGVCVSAEATVSINVICANACPTAVAKVFPNAELFPGQTNVIVIAPDNVEGCVVLDGTMSSDPDGDPLSYLWIPSGFPVNLTPDQEPNGGGTGSGSGTVTLSGNTLTVNITFSGLSANTTAAHIHGPAGRGTNASVLYPLTLLPAGATEGAISQTVTLTEGTGGFTIAQQLQQLCAGLWYINIHSTAHPGGEIRGQIDEGTISGAVASTCLALGSYDVILCVSDGRCAVTTAVAVDVITPCEATGALIIHVQNAALPRNRQRPLIASIKAACASFESGEVSTGANQLHAFQNKVLAQILPDDPALAELLINTAQEIIDAVSGP